MKNDSKQYIDKKNFFKDIITLYGRNVVVEALKDKNVDVHKLHLSNSNLDDGVILEIKELASNAGVEIKYHDKKALSRISKNSKQDQGVALDIKSKKYKSVSGFLSDQRDAFKIIALDGIQNPQNLGMILRSAAAAGVDAIILPSKSSAKISPLSIKASAGAWSKITILHCDVLEDELKKFTDTKIYMLSSHAKKSIFDISKSKKEIYVLGNESDGVSLEVEKMCNSKVSIPMKNGIESLNVAITASIIAFS